MANADRPNGFEPILLISSRPYNADAGDSTAVFINDVVEAEADGNISPAAAGSVLILGAALDYSAASTANLVAVADSPMQEFHAQDDAGATLTQAALFTNCNHVAGAGSTTTLHSAHELDSANLVTSTAGFQLLDIVSNVDNAAGDNAVYRVVCKNHMGLDQIGV